MDANTIATIGIAGASVAGTAVVWAVQQSSRLSTHVAEDKLVHDDVRNTLARIEHKLDQTADWQLRVSRELGKRDR